MTILPAISAVLRHSCRITIWNGFTGSFKSPDDCSKDTSWQLCQELAHRYANVRCYQNAENSGVSFTRNHGLSKATGEYVLFVDSDDWVSGEYAYRMLHAAQENPDSLVICGLHFIDEVNHHRRDYIWQEGGRPVYSVDREDYFDLLERFHIQQVWNKVFRKDVIVEHQLRFDENQRMGEDFQFVLDYMEAAQIQRCAVLNEPLYYYVRLNTSSLMSNFGLVENQNEYERLKQLTRICGPRTEKLQQRYQSALNELKQNYVYQMMHSSRSKEEKLSFIESVMQDGQAAQHYHRQATLLHKEKVAKKLSEAKEMPGRIRGALQRKKRDALAEKMKGQLAVRDVTLISQNCIGGVFYHDMGLQFTSPTINLFFKAPDFMKFVQKLDYYMGCELRMTWGEEYPIGYLDDVAIYFMHYRTCREAKEAWEKRKARINRGKIVVLCTDMEDFNDEAYEEWKKICYPKVLFTATKRDEPGTVYYPEYEAAGRVPDLIPKREFYKDGIMMRIVNGAD